MPHTPRISPRWEAQQTVSGFRQSPPNAVLVEYARALRADGASTVLDLGCGAARNMVPLLELGFTVVGTDLSAPMLASAKERVHAEAEAHESRAELVLAPMAPLPFEDARFDLVVAHGIWNLAESGAGFRAAVAEGARVTKTGGHLFLFTFSRNTIGEQDAPVPGETFVFAQFNGDPQCFLTEGEILDELGQAGFVREPPGPLTEYNRPERRRAVTSGPPMIFEGTFVRK